MKQAMIFAAGLGTRLKPLTDTMPKALVPVNGQPLLWHVLMKLRESGFERIVVNVHHFASQIVDYLEANGRFGLDLHISDETEALLDTGGGIRHALPFFDPSSPVLIHNVDILSNVDLQSLYGFVLQSHTEPLDAALLVSERTTKRYLLFDEDRRLQGWTNIVTGELKGAVAIDPELQTRRPSLRQLAFSGIHVLAPSTFPLLRSMPERFGIIDFYLEHCRRLVFEGVEQPGLRLIDVGKLDTLDRASQFVAAR